MVNSVYVRILMLFLILIELGVYVKKDLKSMESLVCVYLYSRNNVLMIVLNSRMGNVLVRLVKLL